MYTCFFFFFFNAFSCTNLCVSFYSVFPGCTLLFFETYSKGSPEQELSPRYALLAEDSIVQAVPEHPKKENVFCLSNSYGDVYLFQVWNASCSWCMYWFWSCHITSTIHEGRAGAQNHFDVNDWLCFKFQYMVVVKLNLAYPIFPPPLKCRI